MTVSVDIKELVATGRAGGFPVGFGGCSGVFWNCRGSSRQCDGPGRVFYTLKGSRYLRIRTEDHRRETIQATYLRINGKMQSRPVCSN